MRPTRFLVSCVLLSLAFSLGRAADSAPEDQLATVARLVQEEKLAEAAKRVDLLLQLYPEDKRLAQLRTRLAATAPTAGAPSAAPAGATPGPASEIASLTGLDRVQATAVEALTREADQLPAGSAARRAKFTEVRERLAPLVKKHPAIARLWLFNAIAALELDDFSTGNAAGERLLANTASPDEQTMQVLAQLELKGWLGEKGVERKTKEEKAAADKISRVAAASAAWRDPGGKNQTIPDPD